LQPARDGRLREAECLRGLLQRLGADDGDIGVDIVDLHVER
jgi:hypothetical protein